MSEDYEIVDGKITVRARCTECPFWCPRPAVGQWDTCTLDMNLYAYDHASPPEGCPLRNGAVTVVYKP